MKVEHEFEVHAVCPFIPDRVVWDYYTVTVHVGDVVDVHLIERVIDGVRGDTRSQEDLATVIAGELQAFCKGHVTVDGRHSSNSYTSVAVEF